MISLSLTPNGRDTANFSKALNRFQKEDPTFRVHVDSESKEVRIPLFLALNMSMSLLKIYFGLSFMLLMCLI